MSKKNFTDGLESLLTEAPEQDRFLSEKPPSGSKSSGKKEAGQRRSTGSKNFTSNLQSFLQDTFEESFEERLQQLEKRETTPNKEIKKRSRKPLSGLDALIRQTIEPSSVRVAAQATRRLVVAFDEQQLQKLRQIAKLEKTYLKKIIVDLVEDYINTYETQKGDLD